jgi:hypothetical protein
MEPARSVKLANRPVIVVVEASDPPRPTSTRIAAAFARAQLADVLMCHWHDLHVLHNGVLASQGTRYDSGAGGKMQESSFHSAVWAAALFFFAPRSGLVTEIDLAHMRRLGFASEGAADRTNFAVIDNILWKASHRGLVTNALGPDKRWGPKHEQEFKLRRYEEASGKIILRPNTHVAGPSTLPRLLDRFAGRGEACIVKPAYSDGGRGITIVGSTERTPGTVNHRGTVVVQELLWHPLLVGGRKADLRCYLLLDVHNQGRSGQHGPIFVRRASAPYKRGALESEITNTAYRHRRGLPPDILPIEHVPSIRRELRMAITAQLTSLLSELARAYFFDIESSAEWPGAGLAPHRVALLGADVFVSLTPQGPIIYLLEVNPFPSLYRGSPQCDLAIDEMLATRYLPALLGLSSEV